MTIRTGDTISPITVLYLRFTPPFPPGRTALLPLEPAARRSTRLNPNFLRFESLRGLVEAPCRQLLGFALLDALNHVREPARSVGPVEFGWLRGMVRMTVVDPDQVEAFLSRRLVRVKQLQWIDVVSAGALLPLGGLCAGWPALSGVRLAA